MRISKKKQPKNIEEIQIEEKDIKETEAEVQPEVSDVDVQPEVELEIPTEENTPEEEAPVEEAEELNAQSDEEETEKTVCRVVYASPNRFIVMKNGKEVQINEKNNHFRGEDIYL